MILIVVSQRYIWLRKTIATSKIKPVVVKVSGFQQLTDVTKKSISGVVGVLDSPLERYMCSKICAGVQGK